MCNLQGIRTHMLRTTGLAFPSLMALGQSVIDSWSNSHCGHLPSGHCLSLHGNKLMRAKMRHSFVEQSQKFLAWHLL